MKSLNPQQIATLESSLRQLRTGVIGAIRQHLHQSDQPDERALSQQLGDDDGASAASLGELGIAQLRHECDELKDIDAALQRIAGGSYGQCVQCGAAIAFERMSAQPVASACLACQQDVERRYGSWSKG